LATKSTKRRKKRPLHFCVFCAFCGSFFPALCRCSHYRRHAAFFLFIPPTAPHVAAVRLDLTALAPRDAYLWEISTSDSLKRYGYRSSGGLMDRNARHSSRS
jgi:hypothetical protein